MVLFTMVTYESMQDHALSEGPLTFPMMDWSYYVRNPPKELCFNDLLCGKGADESYNSQQVANTIRQCVKIGAKTEKLEQFS
jgi:hypothetical protein